ncbi:hypothetical protein JCM11251_001844 [Rhodosporidiobolus azoricus]
MATAGDARSSLSSDKTLTEPSGPSHKEKKQAEGIEVDDGRQEAAEELEEEYGGDVPLPLPDLQVRPMPQPHQPPTFSTRGGRRGSMVGRTRSSTVWSEKGFPALHLQDSAFSDAHRQLSRISRRSGGTPQGNNGQESTGQEEGEGEEEEEEDPNKVQWQENDPDNPQNWSNAYKWWITILCAQSTVSVTFASSAPSSALTQMSEQFNVSSVVAALVTSLFLVGYCCGPLLWAPMSEIVGRRPVFVGTMIIFAIWQIGDALAQNIWTVIIVRFFAAVFASSPLTNAGGIIADTWDPVNRGKAMAAFSASVFIGPVIGPIVGGFTVMNDKLRWPWIFWFIGIWGLASWVLIAIFLPETYHPKLLAQRAKKLRKEDPEKNAELYADLERADFSFKSIVTRTLARPIVMLFTEPLVMVVTLYLSVVYGILYGLFSVFPIVWQQLRGFNEGEGGLIFIGVGIGTTLGALLSVYVQRHYREIVPLWHGHPPPEERLYGAMVAGPCIVVGIFWLGWTGNYPSVHWAIPAASSILIGMSFTLVFVSFLTYLVDVYLFFSASALAANTIVRSAVAAAFPLFTQQMFAALGVNWACSLLGFVALAIAPSPLLFYRYGWRLRQKSKFAPCLDIGMREKVEREKREKDGQPADQRV